ncbi:MAG: hypothetical protein ACE5D6_01480 [Candidatus Zixiibacteriota bacterium]
MMTGKTVLSQELSTLVFPSEDEIIEAFQLREISFEQFLILQELIIHGVDSTNFYLLDEIPNLSYFKLKPNSLATDLEQEQQIPFSKLSPGRKKLITNLTGNIKHKYFHFLEDVGDAKYQSSIRLQYKNRFYTAIKIHREYSGRERIISRFVAYKNNTGYLRELILGNFSKRLGLGTAFGYRGKLFSYSTNLNSESLLYPDYGGYNGIYSRWSLNQISLQSLASISRDSEHRLISSGVMVTFNKYRFSPGVVIGVNQLKNRLNDQTFKDYKYGLYSNYKYQKGYFSFELMGQTRKKNNIGSFVTEGRHRFRQAELKYAGWVYSDDFIDLTSGSKAGNISRTSFLEKIGFEYSDKRSDQTGALIKTIVELDNKYELASSFIYAANNSNNSDIQWFTELTKKIHSELSISLDYLYKYNRRSGINNDFDDTIRQTRVEVKFVTKKLYLRSFIGYNTESENKDFLSIFLNMRFNSDSYGLLEIWSNIGEIETPSGELGYWYGFFKNDFYLFDNLKSTVKFSHTYSRSSKDKHRTLVSFEMNFLL